MKQITERQDSLFNDYQKLQDKLIQCDKSHSQLQLQDCRQKNSILEQFSDCRFKLKQAQSELANKEHDQIRKALFETRAELDQTKMRLSAYIESAKQFESFANSNDTDSQQREVIKLKILNTRLNEELQAITNSKLKIQGLLGDRLNQLQAKLNQKSNEYDKIVTKFVKLQQTGTYLREEELLAWKKRQESILNFLQRLNHQLDSFKLQKATVQKMKKQESYQLIQELDLLKKSTCKVQEFWHQQHITWTQQRQQLQNQIQLMQGRVYSSSTFYNEMGKLLEREKEIYENVNEKLKNRMDIRQDDLESYKIQLQNRAQVRKSVQVQKQEQVIATLEQQVSIMKKQLNIERVDRIKEMEAKQLAAGEKLAEARRKQINAVTHLANVEQKYKNLQQIFNKLGDNKAKQIDLFKIQVLAIKKLLDIEQKQLVDSDQPQKVEQLCQIELQKLWKRINEDVKKECQSLKEKNSIEKVGKRLKQIEELLYRESNGKDVKNEELKNTTQQAITEGQQLLTLRVHSQSRLNLYQNQMRTSLESLKASITSFIKQLKYEKSLAFSELEIKMKQILKNEENKKKQFEILSKENNDLLNQVITHIRLHLHSADVTEQSLSTNDLDRLIQLLQSLRRKNIRKKVEQPNLRTPRTSRKSLGNQQQDDAKSRKKQEGTKKQNHSKDIPKLMTPSSKSFRVSSRN